MDGGEKGDAMNILDYIDWRGDLTMLVSPFNEVDNLILAEIAYADLMDIVPEAKAGRTVTMREAYERYIDLGRETSYFGNDPGAAFCKAAASVRFGSIGIGFFEKDTSIEEQFQFTAMTFFLDDGTLYVAYRGTDNTIVGWREDFNFAYMTRTEGQNRARRYLNRVCAMTTQSIRVGGHSKGGNLAVYAAAFCDDENRSRISEVYSNDGPGFNREIAASDEYARVVEKVRYIIPESSFVGILLKNAGERRVVDSTAKGIQQHNPYTWKVWGTAFQEAEDRTLISLMMEDTFGKWADSLDEEQTQEFVNGVFDLLESAGAYTFKELRENRISTTGSMLRTLKGMDREMQTDLL